jgi:type III secretion protein L
MTLLSLIYQGDVSLKKSQKVIPQKDYSEIISTKDLIAKAKEDIKAYKKENKELCEKLKSDATEAGFQKGLEDFNSHLILLDKKVKEMRLEIQNQIIPLAMQATKKIMGKQLELKPELVVDIVLQALRPVSQNYEIKLLVSKHDKEIIEKDKDRIKNLLDHVKVLAIEEREDISQGSCIIETESGIINATLENQFRALEAALDYYYKR